MKHGFPVVPSELRVVVNGFVQAALKSTKVFSARPFVEFFRRHHLARRSSNSTERPETGCFLQIALELAGANSPTSTPRRTRIGSVAGEETLMLVGRSITRHSFPAISCRTLLILDVFYQGTNWEAKRYNTGH